MNENAVKKKPGPKPGSKRKTKKDTDPLSIAPKGESEFAKNRRVVPFALRPFYVGGSVPKNN